MTDTVNGKYAIGVAAASNTREPIILAALQDWLQEPVNGSRGNVSVSSQTDVEHADIERERKELIEMPELELQRLAEIYEKRGLKKETALTVAKELMDKDALAAHVRDELGINEITQAKPIQAAFASGASFTAGGIMPFLVTLFLPVSSMNNHCTDSPFSFS